MRTANIAFRVMGVFLLTFFQLFTANSSSPMAQVLDCRYDQKNPTLESASLSFKSLNFECAEREIGDFLALKNVPSEKYADARILLAAIHFAGSEAKGEKKESVINQFSDTYHRWRGDLDINSSEFLKIMTEAREIIKQETEKKTAAAVTPGAETKPDISAIAGSKSWYKKWWEIGPGMRIVAHGTYDHNMVWGKKVVPLFNILALTAEYWESDNQTVTPANRSLKIEYSGGLGEISGICHLRLGGSTAYSALPMKSGAGDILTIVIPAADIGVRGNEFYFELQSSFGECFTVGSAAEPFVLTSDLTNAQAQRPSTIPANQFRIIGVPLDIKCAPQVTSVFGDDFTNDYKTYWRLGRYNSTTGNVDEYPDVTHAAPGRGYWLMMRNPVSYGAPGCSMRPNNFDYAVDYYELALDSGWNQLANPFAFDMQWQSVRFLDADTMVSGHSNDILEDFAYWYNGTGYSSVSTLAGWDGFFVFIKKSNVRALFPYLESIPAAAKPLNDIAELPSPDNWSIHLGMQSGWLIDDGNFIGVRKDALVGDDKYDLSEPPPAPDATWLAFSIPEGTPRLRRADYRPPFTEGAEWKLEIAPGQERMVTATGIENLPNGMVALLILDNGDNFTLVENSSIILPDAVTSARLFVGTSVYLANEAPSTLPDEFELGQNHPNPFNPFTVIDFALPKADQITLEVYNIIGQRVKILVDEELDPGEYSIEWYGDDENNEPVASGIYFYRMKAGSYIQCRKMLLLK